MYDVIVIGAGPAGSYTACKLGSLGYSVAVLEKNSRPGIGKACTGIVGTECVKAFSIPESTILRHVSSATLFSPRGRSLELKRATPQACILDRSAFDVWMADRAREKGAEYIFNCRATGVTVYNDRNDRVVVLAGNARYESGAVVLASGAGSGVVRQLFPGRARDFVIGAQAEVPAKSVGGVEVYFGADIAPGFFAWFVPTFPGMAKVGLLSRHNPEQYLKRWLQTLRQQGRIRDGNAGISTGAVPLQPRAKTCGDRVLVVGDAAGQAKPTTGGGIYYGLICADIAADTLDMALRGGDLSAKYLSAYEGLWQKKLLRELKKGYLARRIFERLSDEKIDQSFDIIKRSGLDRQLLANEFLSFDWHSNLIKELLRIKTVSGILRSVIRVPFRSRLVTD